MEIEEKDYIFNELDTERIGGYRGDSDYPSRVDAENHSLGACWGVRVLDICIESVTSDRVVLTLKLAGTRIAKVTLTKSSTCVRIKENVGGDAARVNVLICADFSKKEIRADGKVCVAFICTKFNQRILKW